MPKITNRLTGKNLANLFERDEVFNQSYSAADFQFDKKVASVFDDMVSRSVPYYLEMQRMTAELAQDFAVSGTNVYDIGCSTGTTMIMLDRMLKPKVKFIGLDNSQEMLAKAEEKFALEKFTHPYELGICDLNRGLHLENASLVTMLLTLQFVRPLYRERVVRQIFDGMNDNGCLILIEKLTSEDSLFNRLFIDHYYDFKKRNGYSETEIANKREALENVLIPYRMEENFELLREVGFKHVEVFFRWYNFCGIIAVK